MASLRTTRPKRRTPRRPSAVSRYAVGVDVGGTTIKAGLVEPRSGQILHATEMPTRAALGPEQARRQLLEVVKRIINVPALPLTRPSVLGVAVPELVTPEGRIASGSTLAWTSTELKRRLRVFGRTRIYSDVQAAAFAEGRFGAGRQEDLFLYVSIGTGISCSLVIRGQPFQGSHGFAIAFASGRSSGTSRGNTLESRVGGPALLRRAKAQGILVEDGPALSRLACRRGPAQRLIDAAARELAMHVAILVNALDPGMLVIGGGLGSAPGRYFSTFSKALHEYRYAPRATRLGIRQAQLGPLSGLVGAASWAAQDELPRGHVKKSIADRG